MRYMRLAVVTVALLAIIGLVRLDTSTDVRPLWRDVTEEQAGRFPLATTSGKKSVDALWYCAAGQVHSRLAFTHTIVLANSSETSATATLSASPVADGDAKKVKPKTVELPPNSVTAVPSGDLGTPNAVAVTVRVSSGSVTVEHRLTTEHGADQKPCASRVSSEWYFAYSSTEKDATVRLFLYNPLADSAIVDITTSTPESVRIPAKLNGVILAGGQVKEINVNANALRWPHVALSVKAREGAVVAELVQSFDEDNLEYNQKYGEELPAVAGASGASGASGTSGAKGAGSKSDAGTRIIDATTGKAPFVRRGVALVPGVPTIGSTTQFLDGNRQKGVREWVVLYNPTADNAVVDIAIVPLTAGELAPEPVQKTVPPGRFEVVKVEEDQRIPAVGFHRIEVSTVSKGRVVPALVQMISEERPDEPATGQLRPAVKRGLSIDVGVPVAATEWMVPTMDISESDSGWLFINNPSSSSIALVTVTKHLAGQAAPIDGLNPMELAPSTQTAIEIPAGESAGYDVVAEQPVVVERRWVDDETSDFSSSAAVPAGATTQNLSKSGS